MNPNLAILPKSFLISAGLQADSRFEIGVHTSSTLSALRRTRPVRSSATA
ncbi:hypothetical protein [Leucobacter tardus]|uniref:Uncharacterized protein n=1 Tax=Leucobacter tardus TaxID=501483 RepID=A0A939QEC5_9MICO|nr:hypothetical protein [Leucobacter tardus]MBO2988628.1 hypothetical protein [Leucobacter tardus]